MNATLDAAAAGSPLRFDLPAAIAGYGITQPETVHVTLPATAVSSGAPIRVDPPMIILAERRAARFGGHLSDGARLLPEESNPPRSSRC